MPKSTTKIILSTSLTGVVIGSIGAGVYLFNSSSTVKKRLIAEGFNIGVSNEEWKTILEKHNEQGSTNLFTPNTGEVMSEEWLKNRCNETLNKKDEVSYKYARQWCVKTEAISVILTRAKIKVLNNQDSSTEDQNHWKTKLKNLEKDIRAQSKITITSTKTEDEQIKEFKVRCTEITKVENINKTFDENFELAKEWCSIKAS